MTRSPMWTASPAALGLAEVAVDTAARTLFVAVRIPRPAPGGGSRRAPDTPPPSVERGGNLSDPGHLAADTQDTAAGVEHTANQLGGRHGTSLPINSSTADPQQPSTRSRRPASHPRPSVGVLPHQLRGGRRLVDHTHPGQAMSGVLVVIAGVVIGAVATLGIAGRVDERRRRRPTPAELKQARDANERHLRAVIDTLADDPFPLTDPAHLRHTWECWNIGIDPALVAQAERAEP